MKLFLVLNKISHSFALLTREISWSTLEINFIFPHIPCIILYLNVINKFPVVLIIIATILYSKRIGTRYDRGRHQVLYGTFLN